MTDRELTVRETLVVFVLSIVGLLWIVGLSWWARGVTG